MRLLKEQYENIQEKITNLKAERQSYIEMANEVRADIKCNEVTDTGDTFSKISSSIIQNDIAYLESLLANSTIVEVENNGKIGIGITFGCIIDFGDEVEENEYTLVEKIDGLSGNYVSVDSPLGKSVIGKRQGENFRYEIGKCEIKGKITKVLMEKKNISPRHIQVLNQKLNQLIKKRDSMVITNMSLARKKAILEMEIQKCILLLGENVEYDNQKKSKQKTK